MADKNARLDAIIRPLLHANYQINVSFASIERTLAGWEVDYGLDMDPDFQRGHVWDARQQLRFIEGLLDRSVPNALRVIQWNSPAINDNKGAELPETLVLLDGKQRLNAVRLFMRGDIKPFGLTLDDLDGTRYSPRITNNDLVFAVHSMTTREQLLDFYLRVNSGGTPHTPEELARVAALLEAERSK